MKNLFTYLDSLSGEAILLSLVIIAYIYLFLWARKNWRKSIRDERNSRTQYEVTEQLDNNLKEGGNERINRI